MQSQIKPQETLTLEELANEWNMSTLTIYSYMKQGIPHRKDEKRYYFNLLECQKWYRQYTW